MDNLMDKVVSLSKRRGFIYPGSEIYGGLANSWDYGPAGTLLKNNIKNLWWKRFVQMREDVVGLDATVILNPKVWEASGHVANFVDPLIECTICHERVRADKPELKLEHEKKHKGETVKWTEPKMFNLMFRTTIGSLEDSSNTAYLRPETAQAIFVDFKNVVNTTRVRIPFGVAQIGKAFRNEITPGNFIFRVREFEQMEIEYFIAPPKTDSEWQEAFEHWRMAVLAWMADDLGLDVHKVEELDVPEKERAHYSKKTIDFLYDFPFGKEELYGLAYRTDFDLKQHQEFSGQDLQYRDPDSGETYIPHVIEPSFGVDRTILAVLIDAYHEDPTAASGQARVVLKLSPKVAPYKAAVFPLVANKPELVSKAKEIYSSLKQDFMVAWDDRGNIGKRYLSQDELGTPYCITVDYQTLEDNTVTIRDRDTTQQERIEISKLAPYLENVIK